MSRSIVPYLSYQAIKQETRKFLTKHHPEKTIPVPIERIIDNQLKIDICPVPGFKKSLNETGYDVDGCLSADLKTIYVDEYVSRYFPARYNFTLAHELGHLVLHKEIIAEYTAKAKDKEDWMEFINLMPQAVFENCDTQANNFAGLLLVPDDVLREKVFSSIKIIIKRIRDGGLSDLASIAEDIWQRTYENVAKEYAVSPSVIRIRVELEKIKNEANRNFLNRE